MVRIRQPPVALAQVYSRSFTSHNRAQLRSCVDALAASTGRAVPPLLASATRLHPPFSLLRSRNLASHVAPLGTPTEMLRSCAFAHPALLNPSVLLLDAHTSKSPTLSLLSAATAFQSLHPAHYAVTGRNILDIEMANPPIYIYSPDDDVEMVDESPFYLADPEHDVDIDMDATALDGSPKINMDSEVSTVMVGDKFVSDDTKMALLEILANVPVVNRPEMDVEMQDERQTSIDCKMALLEILANVPAINQPEVDVDMQDALEVLPESNVEAESSFTVEDLAPRLPSPSSLEVTNTPSLGLSSYNWAGVIESLQEQLASLDAIVLTETDIEVALPLDARQPSYGLSSPPSSSPYRIPAVDLLTVEAGSPCSQLSIVDVSIQSSASDESFEEQLASLDASVLTEMDEEVVPALDTRSPVYRLNSPPQRPLPVGLLLPFEADSPCPRQPTVDISVQYSTSDESLEEQLSSFDIAETDEEVAPLLDRLAPVYRLSSPPRPLRRMPFVLLLRSEAGSPCSRLSMVDVSVQSSAFDESLEEHLASFDLSILTEEEAPALDRPAPIYRLSSPPPRPLRRMPVGLLQPSEADSPCPRFSAVDELIQSLASDGSLGGQLASFDLSVLTETDEEVVLAFDTLPTVYRLNSPPQISLPVCLLPPSEADSPCPRQSTVDVSIQSSASDESLGGQLASFDLSVLAETDEEVEPPLDRLAPVYRLKSPPPRLLRRMPVSLFLRSETDSPCLRLSVVDISRLSPFQLSCQSTDSVSVTLGSPSAGARTLLGDVTKRRARGLSNVEGWEEGEGLGREGVPGEASRGREYPSHRRLPTPPPLLSHFSFSLQPLSLPPLPPF